MLHGMLATALILVAPDLRERPRQDPPTAFVRSNSMLATRSRLPSTFRTARRRDEGVPGAHGADADGGGGEEQPLPPGAVRL